jgi:hypothetical protein
MDQITDKATNVFPVPISSANIAPVNKSESIKCVDNTDDDDELIGGILAVVGTYAIRRLMRNSAANT